MTVKLLLPQTVFECSMCFTQDWSDWRTLADRGWTANHVHGREPILLCSSCAEIIANRRAAAA